MKLRHASLFFAVSLVLACTPRRFQGGEVASVELGRKSVMHELRLLRAAGSPREVGTVYGREFRDELRLMNANLKGYEQFIVRGLPWFVRPVAGLAKNVQAHMESNLVPPEYQEELRAISEASGLSYGDLLYMAEGAGTLGCTSVLTRSEGGVLHGRNFDFFPEFLGKQPVIFEYQYPGRNRVAIFGVMGYTGTFTGMNDKGLSVSMNLPLDSKDEGRKGFSTGYRLRRVLEQASTLDEAEAILRATPGEAQGWMLTMASKADGNGAIFDAVGDTLVRSNLDARKSVYALNQAFAEERAPAASEERKRWAGLDSWGYSKPRTEVIEARFAARVPSTREEMWELLSSTEAFGLPSSAMGGINNSITLQSFVYDTTGTEVWFASAAAFSPYARIFRYDVASGTVSVQREPVPEFTRGEMGETRIALEVAGELSRASPKREDFERAFAKSRMNLAVISQYAAMGGAFAKELPKDLLLKAIDAEIARNPRLGSAHLLKAAILGDDRAGAIAAYQAALGSEVLMPDEKAKALSSLAELLEKSSQREPARSVGRQYVEYIDTLRAVRNITPSYQKRYEEIRKGL